MKQLLVFALVLAGCSYHSSRVIVTPQGSNTTQERFIAIGTRAHKRVTEQIGTPNPIPASEPFKSETTASNKTGFEGIQLWPRNTLTNSSPVSVADSRYSYRVTDIDSDPEPTVRILRNLTVGAALTVIARGLL